MRTAALSALTSTLLRPAFLAYAIFWMVWPFFATLGSLFDKLETGVTKRLPPLDTSRERNKQVADRKRIRKTPGVVKDVFSTRSTRPNVSARKAESSLKLTDLG